MQHARASGPQHELRRIAYIWELLTQLCVLPAELIKSKINTSGKLLPPQHVNPSFWKGFASFCNIVLHRYPIANWCCNSSPFLSSPAPELQLDMPLFILPGNKWLSVNILKMTKHVFSDLVWQNGKFLWLYTIVWKQWANYVRGIGGLHLTNWFEKNTKH
jgi:hypothetical protein